MANVSRTLLQIQSDLRPYLSDQSIEQACHEAGHHWRNRKLGPVETVHLFILQVLCFNTAMIHSRKVKSMTADGVKKELAIYCLVYNLVHAVMLKGAARQGVPPDRISFIDTIRWLLSADPGADLPNLLVNPRRPGRHEPRVTKDRQDTFPKMCRPRSVLRNELKNQAKAA